MDKFQQQEAAEMWTPEWSGDIVGWLTEILTVMGVKSTFATKIDKKTLCIMFDVQVLDSAEDERALFISFSYLMIQFLKKKYKRKLRGFHILIQSKVHASHDKGPSAPSY